VDAGVLPGFATGPIIDVRHNQGGNIDSWLLSTAAAQGLVLLAAARRRSRLEYVEPFGGHIVVSD